MSSKQIFLLMACAGLVVTSPAVAQHAPDPATVERSMGGTGALAGSEVQHPAGAIAPIVAEDQLATLDDSELSSLRGGEALVVSNQTLTAITSGNVINGNYNAGNVSLSDHALSSFNGVGNLLINTGGQVALQTGMNLTINVGD